MAKRERIVRYTAEEIDAMLARGESRTDWARVDAMRQDEVERLADEEDGPLPEGWEKTVINGLPPGIMGLPPGKDAVKLRIDRDVLGWFRESGRGYQTRMNNVLRAFMEARRVPERNP
jgi:uncharacterized protein (DUF4415 family)